MIVGDYVRLGIGDNMAKNIRANKKTGKLEYRARYTWVDANGKRRDSQTGWFPTEREAKLNADKLKKMKIKLAEEERSLQNDITLENAFILFMKDLELKANRTTMENTTSDVTRFQRSRTVFRYYFPDGIRKIKTRQVSATTFRRWLEYINNCKGPNDTELAGQTVREYRDTLSLFNNYLANNGYYLDHELDILIDNTLTRMKIKPRKAGKRIRYCPTIDDVNSILFTYEDWGLENFEALYWYTLFMVLFFSGLRSEEIIGLTWKCVHLDVSMPYIDVINAISERESKHNVMARMKAGIYHTKNNNSEREIPILEYYYDVLETYKRKMMIEFGISNLDEYFVFPNIKAKKIEERSTDYQKQKNILRELDRACKVAGVQKTDVQMLRHACATWLVSDEAHGGMGYEESRARDYFGHTSDDMLRSVYAKLDKRQRANRTSETFRDIAMHHKIDDKDDKDRFSRELSSKVKDPELNLEDKTIAIKNRLEGEILKAIREGKKEFHHVIKETPELLLVLSDYAERGRNLMDEIKIVIDKDPMEKIWLEDSKK